MLKNVQEAKFKTHPRADRHRSEYSLADDQASLSFNAFFTHIVAHEMTHGIGPQNNVRASLR